MLTVCEIETATLPSGVKMLSRKYETFIFFSEKGKDKINLIIAV
jgi:hypothetical protein